jgi:hypothetical protein
MKEKMKYGNKGVIQHIWVTRRVNLSILLIIFILVISGCGGASKTKDTNATTPAPTPVAGTSQLSPEENKKAPDDKEIILNLIDKSKHQQEMSYTLFMTGAGISSESKVWLKDNKLKTDSVVNGQRAISIFDLTKGEVISYLPNENIATKLKMEEYQGQDNTTPLDYVQQLDKSNFRVTGTETINDMECKVISITSGEASFKEWISTKTGMVVKVEEELNGEIITVEFKDTKIGSGTVPDNTFALPQGVEIMDINAMMQNSPSVNQS